MESDINPEEEMKRLAREIDDLAVKSAPTVALFHGISQNLTIIPDLLKQLNIGLQEAIRRYKDGEDVPPMDDQAVKDGLVEWVAALKKDGQSSRDTLTTMMFGFAELAKVIEATDLS